MRILIAVIMAVVYFVTAISGVTEDTGETVDAMSTDVAYVEGADLDEVAQAGEDTSVSTSEGRSAVEGTAWADMEYVHYDPTDFYEMTSQLRALADSYDIERILSLYERAYDEMLMIDTLDTIAYINYCRDVTDDYWVEESLYCDTLWSETMDDLCGACRLVLEGRSGDAFADYIGEEAAASFASYEALPTRAVEISQEESELITQYYDLMDRTDELTYSYLGKTWTYEMLDGFQGVSLYYRDYDGYLEVYYGLQQALNDEVGPIYLQLVSLRAEYAQLMGFDSYADLAYEWTYGRDYTTEDAQQLCDAVKVIAREYYDTYYYADPWYEYGEVEPVLTSEELLSVLGDYVGTIDASLYDSWQFLMTYGLYDLSDSADRVSGAFTTSLTYYDCPFIFLTMDDDCYDLFTLTHEFGHFSEACQNSIPNILTSVGNYDLFEIHSNGLEVLFSQFYDEIFTQGADTVLFITLGEQMESLIDGCILDEFQRRVYEDPDMTLDELNRLYADICWDYGQDEPSDVDRTWMYVAHNFESPLYYISYAASSLAALQIWDMSQTDADAAVETYLAIVDMGAYDEGYFEVLSACGLRSFTEDGAIEDICRPVLNELGHLIG